MIGRKPEQFRTISNINSHSCIMAFYDLVIIAIISAFFLVIYPSNPAIPLKAVFAHFAIAGLLVIGIRAIGGSYTFVWRYGGGRLFVNLLLCDCCSFILYYLAQRFLPIASVAVVRTMVICSLNTLLAMEARHLYQYLYETSSSTSRIAGFLRKVMYWLTGVRIDPTPEEEHDKRKISIAIIGAGRVGSGLASDLLNNPNAAYYPRCFIDIDKNKIGRTINGIPVYSEEEADRFGIFDSLSIQETVFAIPNATAERKKELYQKYKSTGCKLKTFDYPTTHAVNGKRSLREFDIEELLFRKAADFLDEKTSAYYCGKTVLISGGGGSIGSELARQIARMKPGKIVILDVYENGAYDVQQELRLKYQNTLHLAVEIVTITDRGALDHVFARHKPDIVIHAAAHKHVPLMETNCCEAIKNNVFGTKNLLSVAQAHGCRKFIMVSTDKAVNPTNVMGATKRMCEMIVLNHEGTMDCSATRFGNVLGSNGSVIPLFKRQIMNGGPVTITDKRIIRYFMTIPEASQLVLTSGAIAHRGELFVLDMGKPVHILELAENMIQLSGYEPYKEIDIIETGLRPGEKLYEELLVKNEELDKTENEQIFIERDRKIDPDVLQEKLCILRDAIGTNNDEVCRNALRQVVDTYRPPEEVNAAAQEKLRIS